MKLIKIGLSAIVMLSASASANVEEKKYENSYSKEEKIDINFRNLSITDFVKMVSKITNKNILIDGKLKGEINFISQKAISKKSLIPLANAILQGKGYIIVKQGDFYRVVKDMQASIYGLAVDDESQNDTISTMVFQLKYINAQMVRSKLTQLMDKSAEAMAFKENNTLIITAKPSVMKSIRAVIERIDVPNEVEQLVIKLENVLVEDVYQNIVKISKRVFDQKIIVDKVDVYKDKGSNSVIVVGSPRNVIKISKYIKELDLKGESQVRKMYVIKLENSNVEDMAKILTQLIDGFSEDGTKTMSSSTSKRKAADKDEKAVIVSDVERNALIVMATSLQMKNIRKTVKEIDIPKVQVYVKVKIVEIDRNKANQVGLKYGMNGGALTNNGIFSMVANMGTGPIQASAELLSFLDLESMTGNASEVFALGASLDLLKRNGAANILSEPSILCTNNKESEIYVGQTRSVLAAEQQTTAVSSNVVNNYVREDIGLTLKVKPRLSSNNKVTLEVETRIEDVLENESPNSDRPTTTKREVKTSVIINDGETIILGGLIKNVIGIGEEKLPILGDIPIIGDVLFTHNSDVTRETNVVIYLTPYVVRKSGDFKRVKAMLSEYENIQVEYNQYVSKSLDNYVLKQQKKNPASNRIKRVKTYNLDLLEPSIEEF